jgi:hypothetical protein
MFYLKILCNKIVQMLIIVQIQFLKIKNIFLVWFDLQLHQTYVVINPFHL